MRCDPLSKTSTHIVDYGLGNLLSISRALEAVGSGATLSDSGDALLAAERIILPGVGAFPVAIDALEDRGLISVLRLAARQGIPILGLCLGMQLLFDGSEEFGYTSGLGLIHGRVERIVRLPESGALRSTHTAWRKLEWEENVTKSLHIKGGNPGSLYFVHSFFAKPIDSSDIWATVDYGGLKVPAVVGKLNVWGFQFHPEKSREAGLRLLESFVRQT